MISSWKIPCRKCIFWVFESFSVLVHPPLASGWPGALLRLRGPPSLPMCPPWESSAVCRRTPPRQHVPPWLPETACSRQWQVRWPRADLVPERCLDDGNHARAAGNKVRDRGSRLWRPRGLLRLHHPPTPSKLSMGELLLLLLSSSHQRSENACGLFSSCKTRKSIGFWESNLFIIHHRRSLIYRDAAVLMSSLPPQTITRRRREKSSKLQNSDNAPKYEATCKIEMSLADIFWKAT